MTFVDQDRFDRLFHRIARRELSSAQYGECIKLTFEWIAWLDERAAEDAETKAIAGQKVAKRQAKLAKPALAITSTPVH